MASYDQLVAEFRHPTRIETGEEFLARCRFLWEPSNRQNGDGEEEPSPPKSENDYGRSTSHRPNRNRKIAFKSAAVFCAEYQPLSYSIEGVARSGSLYTLTSRTGHGKTSFDLGATLAVATGRQDILGKEVTQGRVAYLAFENPDDIRMRLKVAAFLLNIDVDRLGDKIMILDQRSKPEDICAELATLAKTHPFTLIIVDTLAAFFDGKDINNNVEAGEFMRRMRPLTQISGQPSVIVSAHPVKNADEGNLVPYGGGAILNEVDGNLTLWKRSDTGIVSLHWQGKLRGLEFEPVPFYFEMTACPDILDVQGRRVQLPVLRPSNEQSVAERERVESNVDRALLRQLRDNPRGTQEEWGIAIGRAKSRVNSKLHKLAKQKLVETTLGKWSMTPKGLKAIEPGRQA
jgi:hypothetical protein